MYNTHWQIIDIHESFLSLSILIIAQLSADNTIMDHAKEKNMEKLINNAPFALVLVFLVIGFVLLIQMEIMLIILLILSKQTRLRLQTAS